MRRVLWSSLLVAALGGGYVLAQAAPAGETQKTADADNDDATSPDKYIEQADKTLERMRTAMQKGLDEVKEARQEKDSVRLLCVNEPVAAMKGVLRVSENGAIDLRDAMSTGNAAEARRRFRAIKKAGRQMDDLLTAAQNCAGASSTDSTTSVELTVDDNLLAIDPYYGSDGFFYDPGGNLVNGDGTGLGERDGPTLRPPVASGII